MIEVTIFDLRRPLGFADETTGADLKKSGFQTHAVQLGCPRKPRLETRRMESAADAPNGGAPNGERTREAETRRMESGRAEWRVDAPNGDAPNGEAPIGNFA